MVPESILALNINVSVSKAELGEEPGVPETQTKAARRIGPACSEMLSFHIRLSSSIKDFPPTAGAKFPELEDKSLYLTLA